MLIVDASKAVHSATSAPPVAAARCYLARVGLEVDASFSHILQCLRSKSVRRHSRTTEVDTIEGRSVGLVPRSKSIGREKYTPCLNSKNLQRGGLPSQSTYQTWLASSSAVGQIGIEWFIFDTMQITVQPTDLCAGQSGRALTATSDSGLDSDQCTNSRVTKRRCITGCMGVRA